MASQQVIHLLRQKIQGGRPLPWGAVHGTQEEGSAICQNYFEKHCLCRGWCLYFKSLGLHSFLEAHCHTAALSSLLVSPDPVGVAWNPAKG